MTALRRRSSLDRGEWLFVQDPQRAWTLGRVERRGSRVVSLNVDGRRREARMSQVAEAGRALNARGDDLCDLDVFTEGSILHHVRRRARLPTVRLAHRRERAGDVRTREERAERGRAHHDRR